MVNGANNGKALSGLTVLDLSTLFSAPQVSAILADLGADVIKVETPGGDPLRAIGAKRQGRSLMWAMVNRNKRAITLDMRQPAGQELLRRLATKVDVLVENMPIDTLRRWGCTYEELAARNPRLIVVSVSTYGRSGPYSERTGAGTLAEAYGGLTYMTGEADGPPMLPSLPLGDTLCALSGVIGALSACYYRDVVGGPGQHVDVSMYEPILQLIGPTIAAYERGGEVPSRTGSRVPGGVPRNVYRTADGQWIVVSGTTDAQVARVLTLIGKDTPEMVARFGRSEDRLKNGDDLDGLVAQWVGTQAREAALDALLEVRVPAAPVNDVPSILRDPHILARGDVVTLPDDDVGSVDIVAPVPRLSATPGAIRTPAPKLGADNAEVYAALLGLGADELAELSAKGVV
jgi:crotonobetainyl-CoA:carnitine CoA-transferase CaiB-like acyl-CoA transferase